MTEIVNFLSRPNMKTKLFGGWICSLLQVESGNGENIQAGLLLEKFVLLSGHIKHFRQITYSRNFTSHLREITEVQCIFEYL
jgi:hypothetical protein